MEQQQNLPEASAVRTYTSSRTITCCAQCHGCGKLSDDLQKCTRCNRVAYCSRECQVLDWKEPRSHKKYCSPNLLELAMSNLERMSPEEKMQLMSTDRLELIPNAHFSQTLNQISCDSVVKLLNEASNELKKIAVLLLEQSTAGASQSQGNTEGRGSFSNHFGLDVGVETLCLALNMWPGVYTVDSCSGLHDLAWVSLCNDDYFAWFVTDDADMLEKIQSIVETGALGIRFDVETVGPYADAIGETDGFITIDCKAGEFTKCRTLCRRIFWSKVPFDRLDDAVWLSASADAPPFVRIHYVLIGCFGLALNLIEGNPALDLTPSEDQRLKDIREEATRLRTESIRLFSDTFM